MSDFQVLIDDIQFYLAAEDQSRTEDLDRMAVAFAELTKLTNQRLRQCDALLQKGLRGEALQLAEQDPKVLELAQLVSSFDRSHWDELVSLYSLPRPEPLLSAAAENLGNAYWQQEPLTKLLSLHRLLAIGRAPLRDRLSVLRRLQTADAANAIWQQDVRDFEKARLAELDQEAKQVRDLPRLQELLDEIQNEQWTTPPSPVVIRNLNARLSQLQRSQARTDLEQLKSEIDEAYSAQDQASLRSLKKKWTALAKTAALPSDDALSQYVAPVFAWLSAEEGRQATEANWTAAVTALEEALKDSQTSHEQLSQLSDAVTQTGRPVPPVLASRTRLRIEQLQVNAVKSRRSMIGMAVAAIVMVLAIGGWFAWRQWQWSAFTAGVAQADDQIARLEFDSARKRLQQFPGYASTPLLIAAQQRLKDAEEKEETRQASFRTTSQQVANAPTLAAASALIKNLEALQKVPADQREVERLTALLKDRQQSEMTSRERQADAMLKPIEASLNSLQAMDSIQFTSSGSVSSMDQLRVTLREVDAVVAEASDTMKNRRTTAMAQWTILKKLQDGQLKRNEVLSVMTANSLIDPAKVDPAARLLAFETAMQNYVKEFSDDPRTADFRQPSEKLAAQGVLQFARLGSSWAKDVPALATAMRRRVDEITALMKNTPRSPAHAIATEYQSYLGALLRQQFSVEGKDGGLREDLLLVFNHEVMSGLHLLKVKSSAGDSEPNNSRVYYLGEARQFTPTQVISFNYIVKSSRSKTKKSQGISHKDLVLNSTEEAPHVAVAKHVRSQFSNVTFRDWRSVCLQTLEELSNKDAIDPLLRYILLQQVVEVAGQGDSHLRVALAPLSAILSDNRIDIEADWMDPDDKKALTHRRNALDALNLAKDRGLLDFDQIAKAAAAADRELQAKLARRVLCVGWLARASKGNGWECRSQWQPDGPSELLVLVPEADNAFRWQSLGRVVPTGWEITVAADLSGLREGKLVFAAAVDSSANDGKTITAP